jgi:hypothetical protein
MCIHVHVYMGVVCLHAAHQHLHIPGPPSLCRIGSREHVHLAKRLRSLCAPVPLPGLRPSSGPEQWHVLEGRLASLHYIRERAPPRTTNNAKGRQSIQVKHLTMQVRLGSGTYSNLSNGACDMDTWALNLGVWCIHNALIAWLGCTRLNTMPTQTMQNGGHMLHDADCAISHSEARLRAPPPLQMLLVLALEALLPEWYQGPFWDKLTNST